MEEIDGDRLETTFGTFLKIGNVAAGTEGPGPACEYQAADRVQVLGLAQRAGHFGIHRLCQRVLLFRTVQPDHANAILVRYQNLVRHGSPAAQIGMPSLWEGSRLPLDYSRHHWCMAARAAVRNGMSGAVDAPQSLIGVKPEIMLRPRVAAVSRRKSQFGGAEPSGKGADFDSAMRRFESSRPSQGFLAVISYLGFAALSSRVSFCMSFRPSFCIDVRSTFDTRCACRLRVAVRARSNVSFA